MGDLFRKKAKYRLHIFAMGDVGGTLLLGLKLLGGDMLTQIGIFDLRTHILSRFEQEVNQVTYPFLPCSLPEVEIISEEQLFDCDIFVFCASAIVPEAGSEVDDVRLAQYVENKRIIARYAQMARFRKFRGIFAVMSDPVDLLCQCAYHISNCRIDGTWDAQGLESWQVRGYGLGVMHARALYYSKKDARFLMYQAEGRAFGPHGVDLVIANSIKNYNEQLSLELTQLAVHANLSIRNTGYKPYIAPALSSGAISLLQTLRGEWHYSAVFHDEVFFGWKNRIRGGKTEREELELPNALEERLQNVRTKLYKEAEEIKQQTRVLGIVY